jgi:DNA ligase-1
LEFLLSPEIVANIFTDIKTAPTIFMLDGEMESNSSSVDISERFKKTVGEIRRKDEQISYPLYSIFDVLTYDEFNMIKPSPILSTRLERIDRLINFSDDCKYIKKLEQIPYSLAKLNEMKKKMAEENKEGLMIRFNVEYENKRTKNLLKFKFFQTIELPIIDYTVELMKFPNNTGGEDTVMALKNIIVEHKGVRVAVGSGFSEEERTNYAKDPEKLKGKIAIIKYQSETDAVGRDGSSLRLPIILDIVKERDF